MQIIANKIAESFSSPSKKPMVSHNIKALLDFATCTNIVEAEKYWLGRERPTRLLQAGHLMLLVPQLDLTPNSVPSCTPGDQFPVVQKAVYTHPNATAGLFAKDAGMSVNLDLLGHIARFFKYHMSVPEEHTLFEPFWFLSKEDRPKMWTSQLMQGPQKLGRHWKGSYGTSFSRVTLRIFIANADLAWLRPRDIKLLRRLDDPTTETIQDLVNAPPQGGLNGFQLDFDDADMSHGRWPQMWEDLLESTPTVRLLEALEQWPADWIKSQDDPRKFTNNVSTEYLKGSHAHDEIREFAWRQELDRAELKTNRNPYDWDELEKNFLAQWAVRGAPPSTASTPNPKKRPAPLKNAVAGKDFFHFAGKGDDTGEPYGIRGNVHAIAPVEDIPGWQRITFMQDFTHTGELFCYEGVVLPGNQIILGRFWRVMNNEDRRLFGPFIFWNVDP